LAPIALEEVLGVASDGQNQEVLSQVSFDLTKRWENESVSQGFSDNILLGLHYLGRVQNVFKNKEIHSYTDIDWDAVNQDFSVGFTLNPGETFAFHKNVLPAYKDEVSRTMGSEFVTNQGYKVVAGLGGNGICHLASLMTWAARGAGLEVEAKVDHSFAPIEGVPREHWTSVRYLPTGGNSQNQNLYITNTREEPVGFEFVKSGNELQLRVIRGASPQTLGS
jgi:hypothetical protein